MFARRASQRALSQVRFASTKVLKLVLEITYRSRCAPQTLKETLQEVIPQKRARLQDLVRSQVLKLHRALTDILHSARNMEM